MKKILIILSMLLSFGNAFAQLVTAEYVSNMMETKKAKYNEIVLKQLNGKGTSIDENSVEIINIPCIALTKKGFKTKSEINVDNFLSYFDCESQELERSAIKDKGLLFKLTESYYTYWDGESIWSDFVKNIFEFRPDCIFALYNISYIYICIKNGNVFIIDAKNNQFRIITLEDYLLSDDWKSHVMFLEHKKSIKKQGKLKSSIVPDKAKHSYAFTLEYVDNGHGNIKAIDFVKASNGIEKLDARQVARNMGFDILTFDGNFSADCLGQIVKYLKNCELFFCRNGYWTNVTSITLGDKLRIINTSPNLVWEKVLLSMNVWDPIRGHVNDEKGPLSNIGLIIY